MRKRKMIQKMCVLALTFAMLTAPISYAEGETFDERIEQEDVEEVPGQEEQGEIQKPELPGDTGTPGWLLQGKDWYYYDVSGEKAVGWRVINGCLLYTSPSPRD